MQTDPQEYECKEDPCCQDKTFFIRYRLSENNSKRYPDLKVDIPEKDYHPIEDPMIKVMYHSYMRDCPCGPKKARAARMKNLWEKSQLTPRFKKRTFDRFVFLDPANFKAEDQPDVETLVDYQRKAYAITLDYCINFDHHAAAGEGFALFGDVGVGKTHLLASKTIYLVERGIQSVFKNTTDLFQEIRSSYEIGQDGKPTQRISATDYIELLKNCDDLSLDDVGKEKPTEWVRELFYSIINHRYEHELPTSFTTNCSAEDLKAHLGSATYRRLTEPAAGRALNVKGTSFDMIKRRAK